MRRSARRHAGDFAAAEISDKAEPAIHVGRERATDALAVGGWSTLAWIDSDVLIVSGNLHAPGFLGLRDVGREQSEPKQNEQFTHHFLHKGHPTQGWYYYYDPGPPAGRQASSFLCFPRVNSGSKLPLSGIPHAQSGRATCCR
jgi:hypothetical protein